VCICMHGFVCDMCVCGGGGRGRRAGITRPSTHNVKECVYVCLWSWIFKFTKRVTRSFVSWSTFLGNFLYLMLMNYRHTQASRHHIMHAPMSEVYPLRLQTKKWVLPIWEPAQFSVWHSNSSSWHEAKRCHSYLISLLLFICAPLEFLHFFIFWYSQLLFTS
jgi:hypothetical protein